MVRETKEELRLKDEELLTSIESSIRELEAKKKEIKMKMSTLGEKYDEKATLKITGIKNKLKSFHQDFKSILCSLSDSCEFFESRHKYILFLRQLETTTTQLTNAKNLKKICEYYVEFDNHIQKSNYISAYQNILIITQLIKTGDIEEKWTTDEFNIRYSTFKNQIKSLWFNHFDFNHIQDDNKINITLKITKNSNISIFDFLSIIRDMDQLTFYLNDLIDKIYKYFIQPHISSQSYFLEIDINKMQIYIHHQVSSTFQLKNVIRNMKMLFQFIYIAFDCQQNIKSPDLYSILFDTLESDLCLKVIKLITQITDESFIENSSNPAIFTEASDLENFLIQHHFLKNSMNLAENLKLKHVSNQDKIMNHYLHKVRLILMDDTEDRITVDEKVGFESASNILSLLKISEQPSTQVKDSQEIVDSYPLIPSVITKLAIHTRTDIFIDFVINIYKNTISHLDCDTVCRIMRDCFEIYASFSAMITSELTFKEACITRNDFCYTADCCVAFSLFISKRGKSSPFCTFIDYSLLFRQTAEDIILHAINSLNAVTESITNRLVDLLLSSNQFADSFKLIETIDFQFRTVISSSCLLPADVYETIIGRILSPFYEIVYKRIVGMTDITENQSIHMETVLPLMLDKVHLFVKSDVPQEISLYFTRIPFLKKYFLLVKLIKSNMHEIVEMWQFNKFDIRLEISHGELIKLIRSIFQNSSHRSNAIMKINSIL